jgi:hypothetical protein
MTALKDRFDAQCQLSASLECIMTCLDHFPTHAFKQVVAMKQQGHKDQATKTLEHIVAIAN